MSNQPRVKTRTETAIHENLAVLVESMSAELERVKDAAIAAAVGDFLSVKGILSGFENKESLHSDIVGVVLRLAHLVTPKK